MGWRETLFLVSSIPGPDRKVSERERERERERIARQLVRVSSSPLRLNHVDRFLFLSLSPRAHFARGFALSLSLKISNPLSLSLSRSLAFFSRFHHSFLSNFTVSTFFLSLLVYICCCSRLLCNTTTKTTTTYIPDTRTSCFSTYDD